MSDALIQIVDENDVPLRGATKKEAWKEGLRHRIVRVMVENKQEQILLQKRAPDLDLFPGCWDDSAAGHVDNGEDYLTAAKRELAEELGISNVELSKVDHYKSDTKFEWRRLKRFTHVYKIVIDGAEFNPNPGEVTEVKWFTLEEIKKLISEHPDEVTDGLVEVIDKYY